MLHTVHRRRIQCMQCLCSPVVKSVTATSLAASLLSQGDVIYSVNGEDVQTCKLKKVRDLFGDAASFQMRVGPPTETGFLVCHLLMLLVCTYNQHR